MGVKGCTNVGMLYSIAPTATPVGVAWLASVA